MNRQESARIVAGIIAAFPAQAARLDESRQLAMVATFADLLEDLTYEQCNAALRVLLQTKNWMPSVAEIRATVLELQRGPLSSGAEAWGAVVKAIGRYGVYRTPGVDFAFDDPVTAKVVSALSWSSLCNSENAVADRARFIEAYEQIVTRDRKEQQAPMLGAAREAREIGAQPIALLLPKIGGSK